MVLRVPSAPPGHRGGWAGQREPEERTAEDGRAQSRLRVPPQGSPAAARGSPHGPGRGRRGAALSRSLSSHLSPSRAPGAVQEDRNRRLPLGRRDGTGRLAPGALRGPTRSGREDGRPLRGSRGVPARCWPSSLPLPAACRESPQKVARAAGYQFDVYLSQSHQFLPGRTPQWCPATVAINEKTRRFTSTRGRTLP